MYVTVTAPNRIPYLDSIHVVSTHVEETEELATVGPIVLSVSPNPFTNCTDIRCQIADTRQEYTLQIFDITGRLVSDLSKQISVIGHQISVKWDGTDKADRRLGSGVYFLHLYAAQEERSISLILLR
jgi:hypothetical protein